MEAGHLHNAKGKDFIILVLSRHAELLSDVVQQPWPPGEEVDRTCCTLSRHLRGASVLHQGVCQDSPHTCERASAASSRKHGRASL